MPTSSGFVAYQKRLASLMTGDKMPAMESANWSTLDKYVDESVLQDAYTKSDAVMNTLNEWMSDLCKHNKDLKHAKIVVKKRPRAKAVYRYNNKRNDTTKVASFKSQCDLLAFRIICARPQQMKPIIKYLEAMCTQKRGRNGVKGQFNQRYGVFDKETGKVNHFAQNCDSYWPEIGYLMELQIGLEVAHYIYTRHSYLRDHHNEKTLLTMPNFSDTAIVNPSLFDQIRQTTLGTDTMENTLENFFQRWQAVHGSRVHGSDKKAQQEQVEKDKKALVKMLHLWLPSGYTEIKSK